MNNPCWETVKEFYKEKFGITEWVLEMYANIDILTLCVSGASNKSIESLTEIPREDVKQVIQDVFGFAGWGEDIPINPYKMFCNYGGKICSIEHFIDFDKELSMELSKYSSFVHNEWTTKIQRIYYMCETMYDIERKIKDEWI